ncbi:MAG: chloride channel protein [Pseudomonadota bacterium]
MADQPSRGPASLALVDEVRAWLRTQLHTRRSGVPVSMAVLWPIAVALGVATGYAVIVFRWAIASLQTLFYGTDDVLLHSHAASLPWFVVLFLPVLGGLVVGVILSRFTPDAKARGVADVIQAAAIRGGKIERGPGLASASAALVTLSTGGSTGREGPAIHLGAVLASWVSERLNCSGVTARDILGCAAAAAVSASFNAPLAGALFAMEVVLRHYALHAFGPITVAAVAGAVVSRIHLGDITEFSVPTHGVEFYWEMPAFMILGLICGLVAVAMMRSIFVAEAVGDRVQKALSIPDWLRPAVAGLLLGLIALEFPHVIGVGYETTSLALTVQFAFGTAVLFAAVKVVAVAITLTGRMGGGVFSPALMLGALTGCAFGELAVGLFPSISGAQGLYALAGMGAVGGAVLGAPISSTLIVFELTGDFQVAIAVMISVSLASVVADKMVARSFFLTQLERQGLTLSNGPQGYLAATVPIIGLMRVNDARVTPERCDELYGQGLYLSASATLQTALPMFEQTDRLFLPIVKPVEGEAGPEFLGALFRGDAFKAYSRALEAEMREEHS